MTPCQKLLTINTFSETVDFPKNETNPRLTPGLLSVLVVIVLDGHPMHAVAQISSANPNAYYCAGEDGGQDDDDSAGDTGHQFLLVNATSTSACNAGAVLDAYLGVPAGTLDCDCGDLAAPQCWINPTNHAKRNCFAAAAALNSKLGGSAFSCYQNGGHTSPVFLLVVADDKADRTCRAKAAALNAALRPGGGVVR